MGIASDLFGILVVFVTLVKSLSICYIVCYRKDQYRQFSNQVDSEEEVELASKLRNFVSDETEESEDSVNQIYTHRGNQQGKTSRRKTTHKTNNVLPYPDAEVPRRSRSGRLLVQGVYLQMCLLQVVDQELVRNLAPIGIYG